MKSRNVSAPPGSAVAWWLFACAFMVVVMVTVGGLTRLTDSGLSMVEWKPVTGVFPPMSEVAWQEELAKYRTSPEYQKINKGMSLDEFKAIYYWEWGHRLLGRVTGMVFFLPFVWFLIRRQVQGRLALGLFGIFLLGGLQGVIGWYMVKSGLVYDPMVSQYRLALHLGIAVILFALLYGTGLRIYLRNKVQAPDNYKISTSYVAVVMALVFIQILAGAFVAGLNAGLVYNTYPTMNGAWVPDGLWQMRPWFANLFENVTTVQFIHRWFAIVVLLAVVGLWWYVRRKAKGSVVARAALLLMLAVIAQIVLGIKTLLWQVPIALASLHQVWALVVVALIVSIYINLIHYKNGINNGL